MTKSLIFLVLMGIACFFAVQNYQHPQVKYNDGFDRLKHPFDTRVRYRIGSIDERFGVSEQDIKQLTERAEAIWEEGTGKDWFVYDSTARLTINLIFDERQAQSNARRDVKFAIDGMTQSHTQTANKLTQDKHALTAEFASLQTQFEQWQHRYQVLKSKFDDATASQFEALQTEHQLLLEQKQVLDAHLNAYKQRENAFNEQVNQFNQDTHQLNETIQNANRHFTPRQFHKGIFDGEKINIYEFGSKDDLLLTLAHELGHALDIDHNDDPTALMYAFAGEQDASNFKLKPADIALLNDRHR